MADDMARTRAKRVDGLVAEILAKHDIHAPIGRDDELAKLGLTSIDMVELMLAVEGEFDIIIPPPDITTENFRSTGSIDRMVARLDTASDGKASVAA